MYVFVVPIGMITHPNDQSLIAAMKKLAYDNKKEITLDKLKALLPLCEKFNHGLDQDEFKNQFANIMEPDDREAFLKGFDGAWNAHMDLNAEIVKKNQEKLLALKHEHGDEVAFIFSSDTNPIHATFIERELAAFFVQLQPNMDPKAYIFFSYKNSLPSKALYQAIFKFNLDQLGNGIHSEIRSDDRVNVLLSDHTNVKIPDRRVALEAKNEAIKEAIEEENTVSKNNGHIVYVRSIPIDGLLADADLERTMRLSLGATNQP